MNEKITFQTLATRLAEKSGVTAKEAETFLKEWSNTINDGLDKDQSVKIKNLGTLKLQEVSERESIDVATGNRVVIPAHYKVNFIPDNALADLVNEPFALFETTEINETVTSDQLPVTNEFEETEKIIETPKTIIDDEPEMGETSQEIQENIPEETGEVVDIEPAETHAATVTKIEDEKFHWMPILLFLLGLLFLAGIVYYRDTIEQNFRILSSSQPEIDDIATENTAPTDPVVVVDVAPQDIVKQPVVEKPASVAVEKPVAQPVVEKPASVAVEKPVSQPVVQQTAGQYSIEQLAQMPIDNHSLRPNEYRVAPGNTLAFIAWDTYGHRIFWVYIFMDNRDVLTSPDALRPGMILKMPSAAKYGIDHNSEESLRKAQDIARQFGKNEQIYY
ncbi:MAG: HU family DNA-binding protein [Candidatus Symbiothrix sp.]|jgi:nucleoid DNA-binding protein|nr:HU family DNA-binding protein [Candidatus Symbiothrix sp.]